MSKGMNVVYICKDENNGIRPTKNGVKRSHTTDLQRI